jgi:hypothetical protein
MMSIGTGLLAIVSGWLPRTPVTTKSLIWSRPEDELAADAASLAEAATPSDAASDLSAALTWPARATHAIIVKIPFSHPGLESFVAEFIKRSIPVILQQGRAASAMSAEQFAINRIENQDLIEETCSSLLMRMQFRDGVLLSHRSPRTYLLDSWASLFRAAGLRDSIASV